jgi:hypothetical protein
MLFNRSLVDTKARLSPTASPENTHGTSFSHIQSPHAIERRSKEYVAGMESSYPMVGNPEKSYSPVLSAYAPDTTAPSSIGSSGFGGKMTGTDESSGMFARGLVAETPERIHSYYATRSAY